MGTPDYATTILDALIRDSQIDVVALYTQPDKKVGRKQILTPPHTKASLLEKNLDIPIFQPTTLKDDEVKKQIASYDPDFIVVAAYGQILPKTILDIAPCINLHASILPLYRGASPIQDSIKNREKYSGVTAMLMDVDLDTGDILGYSVLNIEKLNAIELFEKLSHLAATLTTQVLKKFDDILPVKQLDSTASYSGKISKEDGLVDLLNASQVFAHYKAYIFWPGIYLKNSLKLKEIELFDENSENNIGEILQIDKDSIVIGCKSGSLKLFSVQPASKKQMNVVDYIRGKRLELGDKIF
jgi:methionyl-tRNA formyltransferase